MLAEWLNNSYLSVSRSYHETQVDNRIIGCVYHTKQCGAPVNACTQYTSLYTNDQCYSVILLIANNSHGGDVTITQLINSHGAVLR